MKDELPQPSRSDLAARKLVEPHLKLNCNRFEFPVPLKNDGILPNNYVLARDRVSMLRKKALKQSDLGEFLSESMTELQENGYIECAPDEMDCSKSVWYLPYFVTSQVKKRIVYDKKSEYKGVYVNDVIMAGPDLLNPLLHVLIRFCLGKFALMADVTKYFFHIKLPKAQRDFFHLLWFENNDIEQSNTIPFCFCVHPWGIKSNPFIACFAFKKCLKRILLMHCTWMIALNIFCVTRELYYLGLKTQIYA